VSQLGTGSVAVNTTASTAMISTNTRLVPRRELRTLAFFFDRDSAAISARAELAESDEPDRLSIAPLAYEGESGTIVALSIAADERERVVAAATRHGGRLVADIPNEWL
jgi:hypothetical protein